jgi:hypothetical protein
MFLIIFYRFCANAVFALHAFGALADVAIFCAPLQSGGKDKVAPPFLEEVR